MTEQGKSHRLRKRARTAEIATSRRPFLYLFVGLFSAIAAWGYWNSIEASYLTPWTTDFLRLHQASTQMLAGEDPYRAPLAEARYLESLIPGTPMTTGRHATLESPSVLLLLAPLTQLETATAYLVWALVSMLAGIAALLLLEERLGPLHNDANFQAGPHRFFILLAAALFFYPVWVTLVVGQTSLLTLLLAVLGWAWARRRRDEAAGLALGAAACLLPSLCILAFYFLALRRPRVLATGILAFFMGLFAPAAIIDFDILQSYLTALRAVNWYGAGWNASLLGFLAPLFGNSANPEPLIRAPWLSALVLAVAAGLAGRAVWLLGRRTLSIAETVGGTKARSSFDLGFAFCLPLALLLAPLGWLHNMVLLLPALALALEGCTRRPREWRWRERVLFAWFLAAVPYPALRAEENAGPLQWFGLHAFDSYALLVLGLTVWALARREGSRVAPEEDAVETAKSMHSSDTPASVAKGSPKAVKT